MNNRPGAARVGRFVCMVGKASAKDSDCQNPERIKSVDWPAQPEGIKTRLRREFSRSAKPSTAFPYNLPT